MKLYYSLCQIELLLSNHSLFLLTFGDSLARISLRLNDRNAQSSHVRKYTVRLMRFLCWCLDAGILLIIALYI